MTQQKGAFEMRHSFLYFVGTHFRIFVRKFLVHLRAVYASPQTLARQLLLLIRSFMIQGQKGIRQNEFLVPPPVSRVSFSSNPNAPAVWFHDFTN